MPSDQRSSMLLDEVEIRFGVACGGIILALLFTAVLPLEHAQVLLALALVTAAGALTLARHFAGFLGLVAWAFFTGFVTNEYGGLTFSHHDLVLMAVLVALTLLTSRAATRAVLHIPMTGGIRG